MSIKQHAEGEAGVVSFDSTFECTLEASGGAAECSSRAAGDYDHDEVEDEPGSTIEDSGVARYVRLASSAARSGECVEVAGLGVFECDILRLLIAGAVVPGSDARSAVAPLARGLAQGAPLDISKTGERERLSRSALRNVVGEVADMRT